MSYIGIVHPQENDTGATLRAKVVTPNKKKATVKDYNVIVKAKAISDYEKCVIDNTTATQRLIGSIAELDNITESFASFMTYAGVNGTATSYTISSPGDNPDYIKQYINVDDWSLTGRPLAGDPQAVGVLRITTTKGEASVTSTITITILPRTVEEVLSIITSKVTPQQLWDFIRGQNTERSSIRNRLNLPSSLTRQSLVYLGITEKLLSQSSSIGVTWTIEDRFSREFNGDRITVQGESGNIKEAVLNQSYTDAWDLCASVNEDNKNDVVFYNNTGNNTRMHTIQFLGLTIKARLSMTDPVTEQVVTADMTVERCGTSSRYLTNDEVGNALNTAVTNPSTQSIYAAIYPIKTDYIYDSDLVTLNNSSGFNESSTATRITFTNANANGTNGLVISKNAAAGTKMFTVAGFENSGVEVAYGIQPYIYQSVFDPTTHAPMFTPFDVSSPSDNLYKCLAFNAKQSVTASGANAGLITSDYQNAYTLLSLNLGLTDGAEDGLNFVTNKTLAAIFKILFNVQLYATYDNNGTLLDGSTPYNIYALTKVEFKIQ